VERLRQRLRDKGGVESVPVREPGGNAEGYIK
jgi:hypothetical protein